jgi:hypothetical protein
MSLYFFFVIFISSNKNNYYFAMEVYKYKIFKSVKPLDEGKLNGVGRAGWQLCGVTQDMYGYVYYLKKKES